MIVSAVARDLPLSPWSNFRSANIGAEVEFDLDEALFGDPLPEARHAGLKAGPGERRASIGRKVDGLMQVLRSL